jgi:hypothetical protein
MAIEHTITSDGYIEFRMKLPTTGSLLEQELRIQSYVNAAGCILTAESLKGLDTDGRPIVIDNKRHYSKGLEKKNIKPCTAR